VDTSGVYIPTGLGNLDKYYRSLFWGTLHPQPFIFVKFVKIKSDESPWSSGLNGDIYGGLPTLTLLVENILIPILGIDIIFPK
jgi:hypothetical protein